MKPIIGILPSYNDEKNRLEFIVKNVERITGLKDFGIYMNKVLTIVQQM